MSAGHESIYLDYAATTPLAPEALEAMLTVYQDESLYGNPSSLHPAGCRAFERIDDARRSVADLIGASADEIVFTSGATEADNLAIRGAAMFRAHRGRHVITAATEHKAVLEPVLALERDGYEVTVLEPGSDGLIDPAALEAAIRDDTQLVSVMHVNNETGVVQDIAALGDACRRSGVLFHSDAAQSAGKLPLDVTALPVDLLSMSAHKMYGPQGVGALYLRNRPGVGVAPQMAGGAQERGRRAGTEPVAQIAGFGAAASSASACRSDELAHVTALGDRLWRALEDVPGIRRNGSADCHYPGILNVSVADVDGESLRYELLSLCVAGGSACNTKTGEASFVLKAMGLSDLEAQGAIRMSFGRYTREAEIDRAAAQFRRAVSRLRAIAAPRDDAR